MATKTDAPVAAPPERALFRCNRRLTLPDGGTAMPGDVVDCTDPPWRWAGVRPLVELHHLAPINQAAQDLAFPDLARLRAPKEPKPPVAPRAVTICNATYRGPTGEARICSRAAGHEPPGAHQ
jgi:hypothetical protein